MNESLDPFQTGLSRQPLRPAPSYLRRRILDSAPTERRGGTTARPALPWYASVPWSWADLGMVWAVAMLGTRVDHWLNGGSVVAPAVPAEQRALARLQHEELFGATAAEWPGHAARREKPGKPAPVVEPPPRSERRRRPGNSPFASVTDPSSIV
jgi:hypothetical protein